MTRLLSMVFFLMGLLGCSQRIIDPVDRSYLHSHEVNSTMGAANVRPGEQYYPVPRISPHAKRYSSDQLLLPPLVSH